MGMEWTDRDWQAPTGPGRINRGFSNRLRQSVQRGVVRWSKESLIPNYSKKNSSMSWAHRCEKVSCSNWIDDAEKSPCFQKHRSACICAPSIRTCVRIYTLSRGGLKRKMFLFLLLLFLTVPQPHITWEIFNPAWRGFLKKILIPAGSISELI